MEHHLAQINIARMLGPIDNPVMADFVANLDAVNSLAEGSEGFIWRLKDDNNNATSIKVFDDEFIIVNMSVWKDLDALFRFTYQSAHKEVLGRRGEWFHRMTDMHMACWFIPRGHKPAVEEATTRLDHLRKQGPTPFAFHFKKRYTVEEARGYTPVTAPNL